MTELSIVGRESLAGVRVAISVSESADLGRLGLTPRHCELVVAEVVRGIIVCGGTVVYGGRLRPEGFTRIFLEEAGRFRDKHQAVELCISQSEFEAMDAEELNLIDQRLGSSGKLTLLDKQGRPVRIAEIGELAAIEAGPGAALTAMRRYVSESTDARVVVGGKLSGYQGTEPGVIEEARLSATACSQLYVAGGYGGAAAAILSASDASLLEWGPPDFPREVGNEDVRAALARYSAVAGRASDNGLERRELQLLAASYRPADIATIVVRGLATSREA
jgi:hypothetical protein